MQPPQSSSITDEFNATARSFLNKGTGSHLLLTKYALLLNFKATDEAEKEKLTTVLFDCGVKFMSARADVSYRGYLTDSDYEAAAAVLERLVKPDSAPFLPVGAAQNLAKVGFEFIRSAESAGGSIDGQRLTRYAALCVEYAEKMKDIAANRSDSLATGKNITPAKRIVLKHKDP